MTLGVYSIDYVSTVFFIYLFLINQLRFHLLSW
jgi:hypothetical protein